MSSHADDLRVAKLPDGFEVCNLVNKVPKRSDKAIQVIQVSRYPVESRHPGLLVLVSIAKVILHKYSAFQKNAVLFLHRLHARVP